MTVATYTVRWRTGGQRHQDTFPTRKLAESFRAKLMIAAREGRPFELVSGLPPTLLADTHPVTWCELACRFVDFKWPHASPRHR